MRYVIDVRRLRTELDAVKAALGRRHDPSILEALDRAVAADERSRALVAERDSIRAQINALSKQVGGLRREGKTDEAEAVMAESRALGERQSELAAEADAVDQALKEELLVIPNIPFAGAPDGESDADNPVVRGPFVPDEFPAHQRIPHWETATALGILDNERATKISKSMFTMQRGAGATLARALAQFALDYNTDVHEEIRPPSLVSTATLTPLTSIYSGEILDAAELPLRFVAYSPCYRREAGSAGRDTRGMLRAHEFDKVEILALSTPEQAPDLLADMVSRAEAVIDALGLPWRTIEICTGDMGQSHHRSFDIEVYAPGADAWLEVSSVSWFSDYQARRANIRYRPLNEDGTPGKGTALVHTLNGSALAVPRVWAAIIENYSNPDGSVTVPDVLAPYMRGITRIEPVT